MSKPGGICCYTRKPDELVCQNGHHVADEDRWHRNHETATVETCAEFEARYERLCSEVAGRFVQLATALGCFGRDEIPTYAEAVPRMVAAIEALKDKARKWDEYEAGAESLNRKCDPDRFVEAQRGIVAGYELKPLESGTGLRAQGGKYTEPGEPIIYVDNGWDD